MKFYEQYPMMRPYIGKHYYDKDTPSLLLIGESHYIPEGSKHDTTAEAWYAGDSVTIHDDDLLYYISTSKLIEDSRSAGFSNKAHSIWRNSLSEINQFGPNYSDYTCVADDVAFYNFFLRPAFTGDSLEVKPPDVEFANEAFVVHCEKLKPTAVIFLSILARNHLRPLPSMSIPIIATPHPGCKWWNTKTSKYGNRRGRDILADYIKTTNWRK
jgi:hypothetical protein